MVHYPSIHGFQVGARLTRYALPFKFRLDAQLARVTISWLSA
jgi:hypothetical protein